MSKIRKLYYFDKKSTEEMISFLNDSANDNYINHLIFNPFMPIHHLLPLYLKFLPESYVLKNDDEMKGIITITPVKSGNGKVEIQKLLFEENSLAEASELVQYVVSRYKAMGAISVVVKVDDYLPELMEMFVLKCGFTQISNEKLWRVTNFSDAYYDRKEFRDFRNSDAEAVANLYNNMLLPHFRPLLSTDKSEFRENFLKGLSYYSEYKYVLEDKNTREITAYLSFRTSDNENYIADIVQAGGVELDINSILHFISDRIKKRKKRFGLFVSSKNYTQFGGNYEEQFRNSGFECVQNQVVLTNSSAKVLRDTEKTRKFTVLNNFIPSDGIPT